MALHFQVPFESPPSLLWGHYLTVQCLGDGGRVRLQRVAHAGNEGELVIYLKQGFVVEGLLGVLSCPGVTVLLRDVALQQTKGLQGY